jgi:hypothetical protein
MLSTGMIETTIPHSEFDDPDCWGFLNAVGRSGFIVDFVCNECGAVVACAREQDVEAAIHALGLNCPVATSVCPHCNFTNVVVGVSTLLAYVCENCGESVTGAS